MPDISPLDLPTSAGVEFGRGDVRHFSESDAVDVVGLQNPTRQLAARDNLLAAKVNELVGVVNNKEQYVLLPVPRTLVAPGVEEVVANFSIPSGFEARILNATVGTTPVSSSATLNIFFASGYGNLTGTTVISTSDVFTAGVSFYNGGEFIVSLRNNAATNLDVVASVTLTMRPLGSTASLLVGSVIEGPQGIRGDKGDKGLKGDPGSGGAGSPGLVWAGAFNVAVSYAPPQAVSNTINGMTSSYISVAANPASPNSVAPPSAAYWSLLASAGSAGTAGGINWRGPWSSIGVYAVNDAVSYIVNSVATSYICVVAVGPSATIPANDISHWDILTGPSSSIAPTYTVTTVSGTLYFDPDYQVGAGDGDYMGIGTWLAGGPSQLRWDNFQEAAFVNDTVSPFGVAFLRYQRRVTASGTETVVLPQASDGASVDWASSNVNCQVTLDGTNAASPDTAVKITTSTAGSIVVVVENAVPVKSSLAIFGFQQII